MKSIATLEIGKAISWQLGILGAGTMGWDCVASTLGCFELLGWIEFASNLFLVPPLNIALTSSQAWVISSGGPPLNFMCRRHELKLAASGCTYLSLGLNRWEWKMNLFGEKNNPHIEHLMHFALEELYRAGRKEPRQPQAHSWCTEKAKSSGRRGGALSPRKLLHNLSASRRVIMPQRLEETGMAPALRRISSWTGVHWTHVIPGRKVKLVKKRNGAFAGRKGIEWS